MPCSNGQPAWIQMFPSVFGTPAHRIFWQVEIATSHGFLGGWWAPPTFIEGARRLPNGVYGLPPITRKNCGFDPSGVIPMSIRPFGSSYMGENPLNGAQVFRSDDLSTPTIKWN